VVYRKLHAKP